MAGKGEIEYEKYPDVVKAILDKFGHEDPMPINLDVTNLPFHTLHWPANWSNYLFLFQSQFSLEDACVEEDVEAVKYLIPFVSKTQDKVGSASLFAWPMEPHRQFWAIEQL